MTDSVLLRSEAPVFVGRSGELRALLDAIAGPPAVALVEGEPGIGKTRLIREALRHASVRGRRILSGTCHPLREPFPYGPVFELLRGLAADLPAGLNPVCGALRPYLPELAGRLPPAPEPLEDHRARQHQLFRAVRALLETMGRVVMVVEDLHWADDGTRDLVRFLADDPPDGLSTVLSYRREDLPGSGLPLGRAYRPPPGTTAVLIPLPPLDVDGVRGLAAAITGSAEVPAAFATELFARTAGIPFVLEEVLRALPGAAGSGRGGGLAAALDALEAVEVPTLLQEAITDRMAGLSAGAAEVVRAVSVLRVPVDEELLAATLDGDDPGPSLREALLAGVLHEYGDGRYGFRHTLAQQAAYEALPGPDRRRLHRRAMEALAGHRAPPLVQLAYHARHAGAFAEWHRYGEAAAGAARELGDIALAVEVLEELLSDARLDPLERGRLAAQLSRDAVIGLSHRRATGLLRRVIRDDRLPAGLRGEIRLNLGLLLNNQAGNYEQGRADTEIAVEELRDRPELAARGMAALAMPSWGDHPYRTYQRWIEQAEELARDAGPEVRLAVRGNHLALVMCTGDPTVWVRAEELLSQGGSVAARRQAARSCGNFADAAACLGQYAAAQRYRLEGHRIAAECGAPYIEGMVEGTALRLDWYAGRWSGLAERAKQALEVVHDASGIAADAHLVLGMLATARGEWAEATARLGAAALTDPANAPAPILATASGVMAGLRMACGDPAAGCAVAEHGIARVRRKGIWAWAGDLAPAAVDALVRCERLADAERLTAEFGRGIAGRDAPLAHAAVDACLGLVAAGQGRHPAAAAAFARAREGYAALPQPYEAAQAGAAGARSRIATGEMSAAAELAAFAEVFTGLGATRDAARCRRALRGSGMAPPSRRGRRGYGGQLSPRESEVARLVALGHTNREIADVLFLSPRTVEQHVAKVLRKLKVSSRGEVPGHQD